MTKTIRPPSTLSAFLHYVSLNMLAMLGTSCYILADTFFVANGIGEDGLTALNLVLPLFNLMNATGLMIGIGGATKYAIHKARGEQEAGGQIFFHALLLAGVASVGFMLVGLWVLTRFAAGWGAMQRPMIRWWYTCGRCTVLHRCSCVISCLQRLSEMMVHRIG